MTKIDTYGKTCRRKSTVHCSQGNRKLMTKKDTYGKTCSSLLSGVYIYIYKFNG